MSKELEVLLGNVDACGQRIEKLVYSLNKNREIFPLSVESAGCLSDEQEESIDALILRYSQSVAMIQDQIFRGIAYAEQEDVSNRSNRDKVLLMEKLGAIRSAEEFGTAAVLRNKFSHHYPEAAAVRIERLNLVVDEAKFAIGVFGEILAFMRRKGYLNDK
ncbi:MAG: hypothetical protein ABL911_11110 [Gallionella sp.]|nr:hypothetical protein [Gallionella sp.]